LDHDYHDMNEPRETANADVYQAIARSVKDIAPFDDAQGRLWQGGWNILFPEKVARRATLSGKRQKSTMLPQANLPFTG
jgi:hypothetical protein